MALDNECEPWDDGEPCSVLPEPDQTTFCNNSVCVCVFLIFLVGFAVGVSSRLNSKNDSLRAHANKVNTRTLCPFSHGEHAGWPGPNGKHAS